MKTFFLAAAAVNGSVNTTTEDIQMLDVASKIILGIIGAIVSVMLYLHYRQERKDRWLQHFNELHDLFWENTDMAEVRSWIACQQAYLDVKPVLVKRRKIDEGESGAETLTKEEYAMLEKLDKFCNLTMRVIALNPEFESQVQLWERLFFRYWVVHIADEQHRPELFWYIKKFYPELFVQSRPS